MSKGCEYITKCNNYIEIPRNFKGELGIRGNNGFMGVRGNINRENETCVKGKYKALIEINYLEINNLKILVNKSRKKIKYVRDEICKIAENTSIWFPECNLKDIDIWYRASNDDNIVNTPGVENKISDKNSVNNFIDLKAKESDAIINSSTGNYIIIDKNLVTDIINTSHMQLITWVSAIGNNDNELIFSVYQIIWKQPEHIIELYINDVSQIINLDVPGYNIFESAIIHNIVFDMFEDSNLYLKEFITINVNDQDINNNLQNSVYLYYYQLYENNIKYTKTH